LNLQSARSESQSAIAPEFPDIQGLKYFCIDYKGQIIRLYHIKAVADFVRMNREGLKTWRRTGVLPTSLFWKPVRSNLTRAHLDGRVIDKGTMYFYSQEEVLTLKYLLNKYGARSGHNPRFISELHSRFQEIRGRFEAGRPAHDLVPVVLMYSTMQALAAKINAIFYQNDPTTAAMSAEAARLLLT